MNRIFIFFQWISPHHLLSRCTALLADCRSPIWLKNLTILLFIKHFDVNLEEAEETDYRRYASFNAFFTRALRPGARAPGAADVTSPADGLISQAGTVAQGRLLQAKGRHFSCAELLAGDAGAAAAFDGGRFVTIYLSPRDYHRVHMPAAARLRAATYVPGRLFSVNRVTAQHVEGLYTRNERLVCHFETPAGPMAMVLVGAMIVAGIETVWGGRVAPHAAGRRAIRPVPVPQGQDLEQGAEMGRFCLGSTVIVLFPPDTVRWCEQVAPDRAIRCGAPLANFLAAEPSVPVGGA